MVTNGGWERPRGTQDRYRDNSHGENQETAVGQMLCLKESSQQEPQEKRKPIQQMFQDFSFIK